MYVKSPINSYPQLFKYRKYLDKINGFIAGGSFKDIFTSKHVRDIDIFFYTENDFNDAVKYYKTVFRFKEIYQNDNCVAFYDKRNSLTIELIKSIFGTPEAVISQFDFTIVKVALERTTNAEGEVDYNLISHARFFEHLLLNKLVIDEGMPKSVATFNRVLKYTRYGFNLCRESKVKLVEAIKADGDIKDINGDLYFAFD
jgi:hypothetical protein